MKYLLPIFLFVLLGITSSVNAQAPSPANANSTLAWDPVTTYADNTPLTGTLTYKVAVFKIETLLPNTGSAVLSSITVTGTTTSVSNVLAASLLPEGQYRFAVQAIDPNGNVSDWSAFIDLDVRTKKPNAPGRFRFTR